MSAFDDGTPLPPTRLLIRSRDGLVTFQGPPSKTPEKGEVKATSEEGHGLKGVRGLRLAPKYSPDGNKVCLVKEAGQPIAIHDGNTGAFIGEVPVLEASLVEFSPQGTYLSTWQRPANAKDGVKAADNFIITRISDGTVIGSFFQKAYKHDALQWTDDETVCAHLVTNEVRFLKVSDSSLTPCGKCVHKGLSQYKIAPVPDSGNGTYAVGVFTPEKGGKPASVNMYAWAGVESGQEIAEGPKNSRTVFAASEATMLWNAQGNSLLVHTHSDVDKSNTSYYGATGLYVLTTSSAGDISEKINQSKDGPVYDVQWSPLGDKFCLAAGHMPSRSTLYNHKAQPLYEFGEAHRNTIIWAPHGRFVCVAGFGNLAGEMDFYDCVKMKKMGANISHCAVQYGWSPDSRYFMTATLAPRMNVDNGYKIFKYNGIGPVSEEGYTQAFDAMWQPQPRTRYPDRGQSPRREGDAKPIKDVAELKQKESGGASAGAYRPPGARGMSNSLADKMRREAAPVGKVKAGSDGATRSIGSMDVHKGAGMRFAPRTIPGMAAPAAPTKSKVFVSEEAKASKKAREAEKKKAKKAAAEAAPAPTPAPAPAPAAKSASEMTGEEKEKRAKAIKKKLKSIDELKANKAGGAEMNEDQQAKLASEADLLSELKKLAV
jgi:translation initiation factor 2A